MTTRFISSSLLALVLLGGCQSVAPVASDTPVPGISGIVDPFVVNRFHTQATIGTDVAPAASVSFIDPTKSPPQTVVTTVTDSTGHFKLNLGNTFRPTAGAVYYLEAFKGLNNNMAGNNAARVRTLLQFQSGGWTSLNSALPGSGISLTLTTTALSVAAQLNTAEGSTVDLTGLIGKLTMGTADGAGTPDSFTAVTNLSVADYDGAYQAVSQALGGNLDPIASVGKANGSFYLMGAGSSVGISPGAGASVGDTVTLSGLAFNPTPSNNSVAFNGVAATVASVSSDHRSIQVTVPNGATRGPVSVVVGSTRAGVIDYPILGSVSLTMGGIPGSTTTASATLTPSSGPAQTQSVSSPGTSATVTFKGLVPSSGWTLNAQAVDGSNQVLASSTQIDGATDSVMNTPLPVAGPYTVNSGLNAWSMSLRLPTITGNASGSF